MRLTSEELIDKFEFETQLAKLLLKEEPWRIQIKQPIKTSERMQTSVDRAGNVRLHIDATRNDMLNVILKLQTGFANPNKYRWQNSARKLGLITEITADDMCECSLCGELGPLTTVHRCVRCYRVEKEVLANPRIAQLVLERMGGDEDD